LVLVTESRIAGKIVAGMMLDDPSHGAIGQRPMGKNGIGGGEIGIQRAGEREQGAPCKSLLPQVMAIEQGIEIKCGIAIFPVTREQRVIERGIDGQGREIRTERMHAGALTEDAEASLGSKEIF
jgi:hypothetical protein